MTSTAARFLKAPLFVAPELLTSILTPLKALFFPASGSYPKDSFFSIEDLVSTYEYFVDKAFKEESLGEIHKDLTFYITAEAGAIHAQEIAPNEVVYRADGPVIIMRPYFLAYHNEKKDFLDMVLGSNAWFFGVQFSFPLLFQNNGTIIETKKEQLPNALLFQQLQKSIRKETLPTSFLVDNTIVSHHVKTDTITRESLKNYPPLVNNNIVIYKR